MEISADHASPTASSFELDPNVISAKTLPIRILILLSVSAQLLCRRSEARSGHDAG
jgi:hypothetical protein